MTPAPLAGVLARGDVWRGDSFATLPQATVASGHPALDAELPGSGWPRGCLTEMLLAQGGIGELTLLLPTLCRLTGEGGRIALVTPPWQVNAPAWAAAGLALNRLVIVDAGHETAWACEQLLRSGGFAGILAWPREIDVRSLRRLQVAAEGRSALAWLWRPTVVAATPSPAPLRIALAPAPHGVTIHVLKRRGRPAGHPVTLQLPRPGRPAHALARPPFPPATHRGPVPQALVA